MGQNMQITGHDPLITLIYQKEKEKKEKEEEFVRTHGGNVVVALLSNFVYWNLINQILPPNHLHQPLSATQVLF